MVKINRVASVPLIVNDPYFSIWSPADNLYDCDTQSWTGKSIPIKGEIIIDAETYVFMGSTNGKEHLEQVTLDITATQTKYTFVKDSLKLELIFSTELDLSQLTKISEPVTIITTKVFGLSSNETVKFNWYFDKKFCYDSLDAPVLHSNIIETPTTVMKWLGKARQTPLNSSGDIIDIDWGRLFIASNKNNDFIFEESRNGIIFGYLLNEENTEQNFLVAYDDIQSIEYFGDACNGLWRKNFSSMYDLLSWRLITIFDSLDNCKKIDQRISEDSLKNGGSTLEFLTALSYRQSIAAHKLILDSNNEVVFLSKECSSNGCIGTVDVSYPSIPLFLLYQPELVKGMLRPIYKFASQSVWEYEYAPHDVGRYPYANGQVYGGDSSSDAYDGSSIDTYEIPFPFYSLPAGQSVYLEKYQMPIEECGNMLIMVASIFLITHDYLFFEKYLSTNIKWAEYLMRYGQNPENQLCTDDFAGHLAHNTNLSLKAINALGLFGKALKEFGSEMGQEYLDKAKKMAELWEKQASNGTWYRLSFDKEFSWSMKYNIIWDQLFHLNLFSTEIISKELGKYDQESNIYGIPLDNRANYAKADWIMWISALTDDIAKREKIILPVKKYLEETENRVPFSDWYDTKTGRMIGFKNRSVVGACFMQILKTFLNSVAD